MASELDKILDRDKEISSRSPWIPGTVAIVFLVLGLLLLLLDIASPAESRVGGLCGACFGIAAVAFVAHSAGRQAKFNLEVAQTLQERKLGSE
jgi:hypothetical protein